MKQLSIFICALILLSCKNEKKQDINTVVKKKVEDVIKLKTKLEPKNDSGVAGMLLFTYQNNAVTLKGNVTGLTPGLHAIHLHEKADCSSADGKSTGGHWNPTKVKHGKWGDSLGYHKGDIGNITADENGLARVNFYTKEWCIGCGDPVKDILGKAVIVHQGEDDYGQPTGNAGGRVSCAGIIE